MNKTEINYDAIDRELLSVHSAILHFQYFLEGREFTVFTDHNPIVSAMKKKTELKSGRQTQQSITTISNKVASVLQIHLARTWKTNHNVGPVLHPLSAFQSAQAH